MNRTQRGSSHNLPPATPMKKPSRRSIHPVSAGSDIGMHNKRVRLFDSSSSSSSSAQTSSTSAQSSLISPASSSPLGFQLSPAANSFSNESKSTSQQKFKVKQSPYNAQFKNENCKNHITLDNKCWTFLDQGNMNFVYKDESRKYVLKVTKKTWLNLAKDKFEESDESQEEFARKSFLNDKCEFRDKLQEAGFTINNGEKKESFWVEPFVSDSLCSEFISNNKENVDASNAQASSSQSSQINTQSEPNEDFCKQLGFKMFELFFQRSDLFVKYDNEHHEVMVSIPDIKPDNVTSCGVLIDLDPIPMQDYEIGEIEVNLNTLIREWYFDDEKKEQLSNKVKEFVQGIRERYESKY